MLTKCECPWFQQRQRARGGGAATGGEQDAEATIGMTDKVGTIAHKIRNLLAIANEVFAIGGGTSPVATPVEHQELEAFVSEGPLRLPLVGSGRQRAVHEYYRRSPAP